MPFVLVDCAREFEFAWAVVSSCAEAVSSLDADAPEEEEIVDAADSIPLLDEVEVVTTRFVGVAALVEAADTGNGGTTGRGTVRGSVGVVDRV